MTRESREKNIDTLIVVATAYADVTSAVQALKLGAFDYLSKPLQLPEFLVTVRKAIEAKRLRAQVRQLTDRAQAAMGDLVVGSSAAMKKVIDMVDKVAEAPDTTVLIQGESGTGKELDRRPDRPPDRRPQGRPVRGDQLRVGAGEPARERAVRSRARRLHRRQDPEAGPLRGGRRRDLAARRGRRDADGHPGQAAEGAGGDDLPAAGRHARSLNQRAGRCGDQQGARRRGRARRVSPRPLPSARRVPHSRPAAARAPGGHPAAGDALSGAVRHPHAQAGRQVRAPDRTAAARLRLPRQRARAAQRDRTGGHPVDRGSHRRRLHRALRAVAQRAPPARCRRRSSPSTSTAPASHPTSKPSNAPTSRAC